jgi:hypothetical protein
VEDDDCSEFDSYQYLNLRNVLNLRDDTSRTPIAVLNFEVNKRYLTSNLSMELGDEGVTMEEIIRQNSIPFVVMLQNPNLNPKINPKLIENFDMELVRILVCLVRVCMDCDEFSEALKYEIFNVNLTIRIFGETHVQTLHSIERFGAICLKLSTTGYKSYLNRIVSRNTESDVTNSNRQNGSQDDSSANSIPKLDLEPLTNPNPDGSLATVDYRELALESFQRALEIRKRADHSSEAIDLAGELNVKQGVKKLISACRKLEMPELVTRYRERYGPVSTMNTLNSCNENS